MPKQSTGEKQNAPKLATEAPTGPKKICNGGPGVAKKRAKPADALPAYSRPTPDLIAPWGF